MAYRLQCSLLALCAITLAGCGGSSGGPFVPSPAPVAAPTLACPTSIAAPSLDGLGVAVAFTPPVAVGGQSPVPVTCTAQSGATFPVGSSIVTCTATDALTRTASCNFNVSVNITPQISKTSFLAFGDSITNGRCDTSPTTCPYYTVRMESLLTGRYTAQTFAIQTEGVNGERAADAVGRLAELLASASPEVLLLMQGTNDVNAGTAAARLAAIDGLDDMVRLAQGRGLTVFLATIPPSRPDGAYADTAEVIPDFNDEIRSLANRRGATLVDVYAAMSADISRYVGTDDLHPSPEGMLVIGETFYAAIRNTLDSTPGGS